MSAARTTISMPDELYAKAVARQAQLEYATFSDYIQALIRADALQSGPHLRETVTAAPAPTPPTKPVTYRKGSRKDTRRKILDSVKREAEKRQSSAPHPK